MGLIDAITGRFSAKGKASSLYKRGMSRAKDEDYAGAISDYTEVIKLPSAPADLQAMAFFNRALAHSAAKDEELAARDLEALLKLDEAPANIRSAAKEKLARWQKRNSR